MSQFRSPASQGSPRLPAMPAGSPSTPAPDSPATPTASDSPQGTSESIDTSDLEVAAFQELLVYTGSDSGSESVSSWTDPDDGATGNPACVTAAIDQAPASFNAPCKMKKLFRPPFVVTVTATQTRPAMVSCRAICYMLTHPQIENVKSWRPDIHGAEDVLDGNEEEGQACGTEGEGGYEASIRLVFSSLRFVKPTRVTKRYPLFMLKLDFGVTLLLVYKKPTVVLSRNADQFNKAFLILKNIQPMDGRSLRGMEGAAASAAAATEAAVMRLKKRDAPHDEDEDESDSKYYNALMATGYMFAQFKDAAMKRPLSNPDIALLLQLAGYTQYILPEDPSNPEQASIKERQTISEHQWEVFKAWFERKFMPAMKAVQSLWDQRSPHAICPLSTTRAMCESSLMKSPPGAFCVRARLKVGNPVTWVISACCDQYPGASVRHILLMEKHLQIHSLQVWVRDLQHLMYCMDISTGELCHKEQLFLNGYQRMKKPNEESGTKVNVPRTNRPTSSRPPVNEFMAEPPLSIDEIQSLMGPGYMENWMMTDVNIEGYAPVDLSNLRLGGQNSEPHWGPQNGNHLGF